MTVIIITTVLIVAAVLIAVIALAHQSRREDPIPRRMFAMETAEEIAPPENRPGFPALHPELPDSYSETRLVLMVRDPEWLFAYWDIADDHWEELTRQHGDAAVRRENLTLRVFEMADQMQYFDLNVGGLARDWHIRAGKSQTPFYCQLGLKYHQNFITLAVSNTVVTPRNSLSDLCDEEWMLVNDHEQRLLKRLGEFPLDLSSPFMFRKEG